MFSERIFQITLVISLCVHGVIFLQNPSLNFFPHLKEGKKLIVNYVKSPQEPKKETKQVAAEKDPFLKLPQRIAVERKLPPPFVDKQDILKKARSVAPSRVSISKPAFLKPDIIAVKKKITLPSPSPELDKINNPIYLSYYQIVREKIKRAAYQNYTGKEVGEVRVSFAILRNGNLQGLRFIEEKSVPSPYLRETALRSIKDASAFPGFPKELDYPQLSFNLAITFEVE
ncbi:MAG: TonB family protein [Candidatus Omnitrophota bacterium]